MISNVPTAIGRMARNVVLNHPNSFSCQLFRRVAGQAIDPDAPPTVGSMDDEDAQDVAWEWIGNGRALPADPFSPSPMMDRRDANVGMTDEFRFLIEPEEPAGNPGAFVPETRDILYLLLGDGEAPAKLAFEIVQIEAMSNIPPYTARYIANRRDDLHVEAGKNE